MEPAIGTARLEAFSDGVFAIAITLLILEVNVHEGPLGHQLLTIWPSYLAYVTSFLLIGIVWLNHHLIFVKVRAVDRNLLLINMLFLMTVAFIPFPTRLVAGYLRGGVSGERDAVLAYGITFVVLALLFQVLWFYVATGRRLILDDVPQHELDDITRSFIPGVPAYVIATLVGLVSALAAVALFLALAIFYTLPPAWLRRGR